MTARMLTLTELAEGLERDGMRFHALYVFAWHVRELGDALEHGRVGELQRLDPEHPDRGWFGFQRNGTDYQIKIHGSGVAQLTRRPTGPLVPSGEQVALGSVTRNSQELPSVLLGFLIGETLGELPDAPRRGVPLHYVEEENRWRAYGGPFARWIREQALKTEPAFG